MGRHLVFRTESHEVDHLLVGHALGEAVHVLVVAFQLHGAGIALRFNRVPRFDFPEELHGLDVRDQELELQKAPNLHVHLETVLQLFVGLVQKRVCVAQNWQIDVVVEIRDAELATKNLFPDHFAVRTAMLGIDGVPELLVSNDVFIEKYTAPSQLQGTLNMQKLSIALFILYQV